MQPIIAETAIPTGIGILFVILYFVCIIGVGIYVLWLMSRFVSAHEKIAASLDTVSRKLKDESRA
ncbi:MAG TPA: hypothetical protein VMF08_07480 [Candidatus Sulfotelmatobacter sp.]|nr:hypothetical protein [Candidatus Sulfotelmatobacter sp.]